MARILFVQTGNFGEACRRFDAGGEETYHDQRRSVDFVRALAPAHEVVVASIAPAAHDETLAPGLRAIGLPARDFHTPATGARLVADCAPDMVIARLPHFGVLRAAAERAIPSFPCLADVFDPVGPRALMGRQGRWRWRHNRRMRRLFALPSTTAVGNHSLAASRSVAQVLGIDPARITPWEWSRIAVPETPKRFPEDRPLALLYVGTLSTAKGVGDLLEAMAAIERQAPGRVRLTLAGDGPEAGDFRARAAALPPGRVAFLGHVPKARVRALMAAGDAVVVPSRPSYAEGLPNSVVEGLGHRAPLVVAEHSSTRGRLRNGHDALIARPLDPADMARQILRLAGDRALFETLSGNAAASYDGLFVGASWYTLIGAFVADPTNRTGWVARHSLAALAERG